MNRLAFECHTLIQEERLRTWSGRASSAPLSVRPLCFFKLHVGISVHAASWIVCKGAGSTTLATSSADVDISSGRRLAATRLYSCSFAAVLAERDDLRPSRAAPAPPGARSPRRFLLAVTVVVERARRVVDRIPSAPGCAPLQREQLRVQTRNVEQLAAARGQQWQEGWWPTMKPSRRLPGSLGGLDLARAARHGGTAGRGECGDRIACRPLAGTRAEVQHGRRRLTRVYDGGTLTPCSSALWRASISTPNRRQSP